jgi:FAD/FMN-containing dehydrogenase
MDKIHEIDEVAGYALVEPGVTIGRLSNELQRRGLRLTVGSFPPGISVLGNYLMTAVNSHRTLGPSDDILGLEVVMADGTVAQTGSRAFANSYETVSWNVATNSFPNIKNLFIDHAGTLGVVTKGAVRIYNKCEAQTMPLAGFDDYPTALKYMLQISKGNLVQHTCSWHWALYTIIDHLGRYGQGGPVEVMTREPWDPPENRPYVVVVPSIAGFKEQVDGARQSAERLTKELGGKVWTEECQSEWPGAYKFFKDHYMDHVVTEQFQGAYGEGVPMMPIVFSDPRRIAGLEKWGLKFLRENGLRLGLTYYSHSNDQGRSIFLRMTPFIPAESTPEEAQEAADVRRKYMVEAFNRYGAVPVRHDYGLPPGDTLDKTGGHGQVVKKIKKALDPDNIMNSGMSVSIYGKED